MTSTPIHRLIFSLTLILAFATSQWGCISSVPIIKPITRSFKAKNIVIILIDGPRYSETWDQKDKKYIPHLAGQLAPLGVRYTQFYNQGTTKTLPGYTALLTGVYENLNNSGKENPKHPTFLHHWLKANNQPKQKAWIIGSKAKLSVLTDTSDKNWKGKYSPSYNCGIGGTGIDTNKKGNQKRTDKETFTEFKRILKRDHPRLLVVGLRQPDSAGHDDGWEKYLQAIQDADHNTYKIWNVIQKDPFYKNQTAFFITNDHGRHLDNHDKGYVGHGDDCMGCRHIDLIAIGPDFKTNTLIHKKAEQIDLPVTIAHILGIHFPHAKGRVLSELFMDD